LAFGGDAGMRLGINLPREKVDCDMVLLCSNTLAGMARERRVEAFR
jgi:hypothetical protein